MTIVKLKKQKSKNKINQKNTKKFNVVFDLDHTLIFSEYVDKSKCKKTQILSNRNKYISVCNGGYNVWKRPYLKYVLRCLKKIVNINLFTRAEKTYADEICQKLGISKYFKKKLYREDCGEKKDLSKIDKDINNSILIDDLRENNKNGQNFFHISQYSPDNLYDIELLKVLYHVIKIIK